jgi:hypothetical protein
MHNASRRSGTNIAPDQNVQGPEEHENQGTKQKAQCVSHQQASKRLRDRKNYIILTQGDPSQSTTQQIGSRTTTQPMSPRTVNPGKYTTQEFTHSHNQRIRKAVAGPPRNRQIRCKPCHSDAEVNDVALPSDSLESPSSTKTSSLSGDDASTPADT